jgi:hypothetical protein
MTIHCSFFSSAVLQLVAISEHTGVQPTMFPTLKASKAIAAGHLARVKMLRQNPRYPSVQVLWAAPGLSTTQRKVHHCLVASFPIVVEVGTRDAHSARRNTSPGVASPTPCCSVHPILATSGFLCIDTSEIYVHILNPQLEPLYHGIYRAPVLAVVHPIYTSC